MRSRSRLECRLQSGSSLPLCICLGKIHKTSKLTELVPERLSKMGPFRRIEGSIPNPVVSATKSDDPGLPSGQARRLERCLHRFETGTPEDYLASLDYSSGPTTASPPLKGEATQFASQTSLQRMGMHIPHGMEQFSHLPLAGPHNSGIGMPRRGHSEGGCEVQIRPTRLIPDTAPFGPLPDDWPTRIGFQERDVPRLVSAEHFQCGVLGPGAHHTPRSSEGQMNLCICNWNRAGTRSATMASTRSFREIG